MATKDPMISEDDVALDGGKLVPFAASGSWEIAEDQTGMAARVLSGEIDPMGIKPRKKVGSTIGGLVNEI